MAIDTSPTTQDALSIIVQNFNQGLDPTLHLDDTSFVFDVPIVNPDTQSTKNTLLRARPTAVSGKYGLVSITYNRIDLTAVSDRPIIKRAAATKMADIVALLNAWFGINLVPADYVNDNLPTQSGSLTNATLQAASGSLLVIGGKSFQLEAGSPLGIRAGT